MALPDLADTHSGLVEAHSHWTLASGIRARQTLAFTQAKPECDERKTRQVLYVHSGMKEVRERSVLVWALSQQVGAGWRESV